MKLARHLANARYALSWRKPALAWRIGRAYLDLALKRRTPLRYIDVCTQLACNLECSHCFAEAFPRTRSGSVPLSADEWRGVIDQCRDLGAIAVGFTGGEPLLDRRLPELIAASRPGSMLILVNTNGTLLTGRRARELRTAGADVIQISLDSGLESEHDAFRRSRGSFRAALEGLDAALRAGLKATIVPTVSHANLRTEGFARLVALAREKGVLLNLSLAAAVGNWAGQQDLLLTKDDSAWLDALIAREPHVRRDFETNYWTRGCGAATEKLYLTPFGDVLPCPYMHLVFGNVRETPVAAIRLRMLAIAPLEGYAPRCLVAEDRGFMERYLTPGPLAAAGLLASTADGVSRSVAAEWRPPR